MMNNEQIANAWKEIVSIHKSEMNETPETEINKIIRNIGLKNTKEVFATIAAIKKNDGRIYGKNREYINTISINQEATEWKNSNPIIYAGIDDIHSTHINQMIEVLRLLET